MKTSFQRGFIYKEKYLQRKFICKEKSGSVTIVKLVTKIKKHNQLYFGTFVLPSYCYQASAYEACDCTCLPLHMPKTLKTCKKAHFV